MRTVTAGARRRLPALEEGGGRHRTAHRCAPAGRERRLGRPPGPFLALPSGSSARSQRGHLERAYDAFISTGSVATLRPMVADSWRLSRASGVSPDGVLPSVDMLDAELEAYRSAHPLAAVMPLIRRLLIEEAEDAGAIVVVADADARLLWVEGDPALRQRGRADELGRRVALGRADHRHQCTRGGDAARSRAAGLRPRALRQQRRRLVLHGGADPRPDHRQGARRAGHHRPGRRRRPRGARAGPGGGRRGRDRAADPGDVPTGPAGTGRSARPGRRRPPRRRRSSCRCSAGTGRCCRTTARPESEAAPSCPSGTPSCCSCSPSTPRATPPTSWPSPCTSGTSRRSPSAPS